MVLPWKDLDARLDDIYQRSVGDLDEASSEDGETEEEGGKAARQEKTGCIIEAGFQLVPTGTRAGLHRSSEGHPRLESLKLHCLGVQMCA